jgi:hypothetical protein
VDCIVLAHAKVENAGMFRSARFSGLALLVNYFKEVVSPRDFLLLRIPDSWKNYEVGLFFSSARRLDLT